MRSKSQKTLQQIADQSDVPISMVSRILSGDTDNPSFQNVVDLVLAMDGSLDEIAGIEPAAQESEKPARDVSSALLLEAYRRQISDKDEQLRRCISEKIVLWASCLVMVAVILFLLVMLFLSHMSAA